MPGTPTRDDDDDDSLETTNTPVTIRFTLASTIYLDSKVLVWDSVYLHCGCLCKQNKLEKT